jgi:hypothetical protein
VIRFFKCLPIGAKPVTVQFAVPRVECHACGLRRQVKLGFAEPRVSYTRAFARYALDLLRHMTIQDVADHLEVSWDLIKEIQREHLRRHYERPKLRRVREIAIDEISIGKGHRYLTVVLDLQSGAVLFVGDGKGADTLLPFWKRLRASHAKVRAVAIDMSLAYINAVTTHLKKAVLVFDRFHVIKLYNEKLSDLRREVYQELTEKMHKDILKGNSLAALKEPGEPRPDEEGARTSGGGVGAERAAVRGLLPEGTASAALGTAGQTNGARLPERLDRPGGNLRRPHANEVCQDLGPAPRGYPELLRLPYFNWPAGRHQQQDQDDATPSLRVQRPRVLQAEDPRHS